jgi:hypothetical protein
VALDLRRPLEAVKKRASRLGLRKSRRYMKSLGKVVCVVLLCCLWTATARAADPNSGMTLWVLGGSGVQENGTPTEELRVGYVGLLPDVEFAIGGRHMEAPDSDVQKWGVRGYALAHALDTQMIASMIGNKLTLPDGDIYGGLFIAWTYDRSDEWSGGYVVGGLVDWPKGWQTCLEYDADVFNTNDNNHTILAGLRRRF